MVSWRTAGRPAAFLFAILLASACGGSNPAYERAARAWYASQTRADIVIGAVWPLAQYPDHHFLKGIELAVEEINAAGGIQGRLLRVQVEDDGDNEIEGRMASRRLAADPDLVAVIGHQRSRVALPASVVYEEQGIVYLATGATDPYLTLHNFNNVFRLLPSDDDYCRAMARLRLFRGFKPINRAVIMHTDDVDGNSFATAIQYQLMHDSEATMRIVGVEPFNAEETNFRIHLSRIAPLSFDVIFLQSPVMPAAHLIRQAREMGISAPFIGKGALHTPDLWKLAGRAAAGTMIATNYSPKSPSRVSVEFHEKFQRRYDHPPDGRAARAYDAVRALARAIERCGSTVPSAVQDTLRVNFELDGVTGPISFTENGDLENQRIFFMTLRDGKFVYPEDL
jgi:branched-chain amino acid transport system substrate-binding protein